MSQLLLAAVFIMLFQPISAAATESDSITVSGEITGGIKRLSDESIDFVSTPFQLKNNNLLITIGVIGATALTYSYDKDIQNKLKPNQNSKTRKIADAGSLAGDPYLHLGFAALVYGSGIAADSEKVKQTGEMIGEALILADAATLIIKESAGRGRPNTTTSKGEFRPFGFKSDYDSFPSMHTASSFAMASVLSATSDSYLMKSVYYLAASFVGFSRMYKNKHWASDVLFGAALGELSGRVVTNYHASGNRISLTPMAFNNGAGITMVGTW